MRNLLSLFILILIPFFAEAQLEFSTGVENGSYQSMANDLKKIYPNLNLQASNGSLENFQRIIAKNKKTQLTILQEDVLVDRQYKDLEEGVDNLEGIRLLVSLGLEEIHVIARADSRYKTMRDTRGKRVCVGLENSGTYITSHMVATTLGLRWREYALDLDSALSLLNAKKLDFIFFVGAAPVHKFNIIADSIPIKFLPITNPLFEEIYYKSVLTKKDYPFLESDIPTFAVRSLLVANIEKFDKNQKQLLNNFLIAIRDNFSQLQQSGHPKWKEASFDVNEFSWTPYEEAEDIFFPKAPLKPEITLLSGVKNGSYEQFAHDVDKISNIVVGVDNSYGSMDNFRQLYLREKYYVAFMQQDVLIDQKKDDIEYETNYTDNMRVLLPLANEDIHLLTLKSNKFENLKSLKRKKVGVGTINQGTQVTAKIVKDLSRGKWEEVEVGFEEGLEKLFKKEIDALFFVGTAPVAKLSEFKSNSDLTLLPITSSKLKKVYTPVTIEANTYPWLKKNIQTYAVTSVLATNIKDETPEQHKALLQLMTDIYNNIDKLRTQGHEKWKEVNFDFSNLKWPVYPNAKQIFMNTK